MVDSPFLNPPPFGRKIFVMFNYQPAKSRKSKWLLLYNQKNMFFNSEG